MTETLLHDADLSLGQFGKSVKSKVVVSNKAVESFAYGVPLLTAHNEAFLEFMDSESLYFAESNAESIANKLHEILKDPVDRARRAAAARDAFAKTFSIENYRNNMRDVYRDLRNQRDHQRKAA